MISRLPGPQVRDDGQLVSDPLDKAWFRDMLREDGRAREALAALDEECPHAYALTRDVVLAAMAPNPALAECTAAEGSPQAVHHEVLNRLLESPSFTALRTIVAGQAELALEWLPQLVPTVRDTWATLESRRVTGEGRGPQRRIALSNEFGGGSGGSFASLVSAESLIAPCLADLIDVESVRDLVELVTVCTTPARSWLAGNERPDAALRQGLTREIDRIHTSQWDALASGTLETDLWQRWAEQGLSGHCDSGDTPDRAGPLIVVCDESRSMELLLDQRHSRFSWAKALVLAIVGVAAESERPVWYVGFSSHGQQAVIPVDLRDPSSVMEAAAHFFSDGTDCAEALQIGLDLCRAECTADAAADLVLISDGDVLLDADFLRDWNRERVLHRTRCWGVRIGRHDMTLGDGFDDCCDEVSDLEEFTSSYLADRFGSLRSRGAAVSSAPVGAVSSAVVGPSPAGGAGGLPRPLYADADNSASNVTFTR